MKVNTDGLIWNTFTHTHGGEGKWTDWTGPLGVVDPERLRTHRLLLIRTFDEERVTIDLIAGFFHSPGAAAAKSRVIRSADVATEPGSHNWHNPWKERM